MVYIACAIYYFITIFILHILSCHFLANLSATDQIFGGSDGFMQNTLSCRPREKPWYFQANNDRCSQNYRWNTATVQACPILTTFSSRASGDSTRTSRTSRKTMVTSDSICSSRDMVFFSDIK